MEIWEFTYPLVVCRSISTTCLKSMCGSITFVIPALSPGRLVLLHLRLALAAAAGARVGCSRDLHQTLCGFMRLGWRESETVKCEWVGGSVVQDCQRFVCGEHFGSPINEGQGSSRSSSRCCSSLTTPPSTFTVFRILHLVQCRYDYKYASKAMLAHKALLQP